MILINEQRLKFVWILFLFRRRYQITPQSGNSRIGITADRSLRQGIQHIKSMTNICSQCIIHLLDRALRLLPFYITEHTHDYAISAKKQQSLQSDHNLQVLIHFRRSKMEIGNTHYNASFSIFSIFIKNQFTVPYS